MGDLDLLGEIQGAARRLLPITQCGVENRDLIHQCPPALIHGIIERSSFPTRSSSCSALRLRSARKPGLPTWFSVFHSLAKAPDWISLRMRFISFLVSSVTMRG